MTDLLGLGALALVAAEWLGLGWLSGVSFPGPGRVAAAASWAPRLLVGASLVAASQLVLGLVAVGVGFDNLPVVLLLAAAGALGLRVAVAHDATDRSCELKQQPVTRAEGATWAVLGVVLLAALGRSLVVPEAGWDAFSHWGLRAQAFANAATLVNAHSEHEYYPPLVPLLEAWLYVQRGQVSIDQGKTVWALVGGAFGVCLAWHLRQSLRAAWLAPLLAAAIVLATPALLEGFWTGQADLALTTYLCLATLAVWRGHQAPTSGWLAQAGVFAAAATLTKFEGAPRLGVLLLALLVEWLLGAGPLGRPAVWRAFLVVLGASTAAALLWAAFELTHAIAANGEHVGAFQPLAIGSVLLALLAVFGGVRSGGGLLVAALAWLASWRWLLQPPLRLLAVVVVGQALATLVAFLVSATAPALEVQTSAPRLVEQFLPLALFAGAVGLARTLHL